MYHCSSWASYDCKMGSKSLPISLMPTTPPVSTALNPVTPTGRPTLPAKFNTTPLNHNHSAYQRFASSIAPRNARFVALGREGSPYFVGPMPVSSFLTRFMPETTPARASKLRSRKKRPDPLGRFDGDLFFRMKSNEIEAAMTNKLQHTLQSHLKHCNVVNTSTKPDVQCGLSSPDVTIYRLPYTAKQVTDFSCASLLVEVKKESESDPFNNSPQTNKDIAHITEMKKEQATTRSLTHTGSTFVRDTERAYEILGQLMTYTNAQFSTQFRTFTFSALIFGDYARFIRWDRSGAIVTEAFQYRLHPSLFLSFFTRYELMSDMDRGYDDTVSIASLAESELARNHLPDCKEGVIVYKFRVPQGQPPNTATGTTQEDNDEGTFTMLEHSFLAPAPRWRAESPFGRGSRAFPAWCPELNRASFLKDYWRYTEPGIQKETDTYSQLHAADVPNIPRLEGGDDLGFRTITQLYVDEPWVIGTPSLFTYAAFRMALLDVGKSLYEFRSSRELVTAIRDAMKAHKVAYEKAKILHRDISVGNILLTQNGDAGLLIDWELCKKVQETGTIERPRRKNRTGTWQFISIAMLRDPTHQHGVSDDLESFFWVLLYMALLGITSNLNPDKLFSLVAAFDDYSTDGGQLVGGQQKVTALRDIISDSHFIGCQALTDLVATMTEAFTSMYTKVRQAQWDAYHGDLNDAVQRKDAHLLEVLRRHPYHTIITNRQLLKGHQYLLDLLENALRHHDWPANDQFTRQKMVDPKQAATEKKRKSTHEMLMSAQGPHLKKLKTDPNTPARLLPVDQANNSSVEPPPPQENEIEIPREDIDPLSEGVYSYFAVENDSEATVNDIHGTDVIPMRFDNEELQTVGSTQQEVDGWGSEEQEVLDALALEDADVAQEDDIGAVQEDQIDETQGVDAHEAQDVGADLSQESNADEVQGSNTDEVPEADADVARVTEVGEWPGSETAVASKDEVAGPSLIPRRKSKRIAGKTRQRNTNTPSTGTQSKGTRHAKAEIACECVRCEVVDEKAKNEQDLFDVADGPRHFWAPPRVSASSSGVDNNDIAA